MSEQHTVKDTDPYALLHGKLVAFQREIVSLKQNSREQEEAFRMRENGFLLDLFEIVDALDFLESNMQSRQDSLDKTGRRLMKNIKAIIRKLLRLLASRHIEPLEVSGDSAQMGQCKIVATKIDPKLDNETIIAVQKKGYVDTARNCILRKAEVVTICNK